MECVWSTTTSFRNIFMNSFAILFIALKKKMQRNQKRILLKIFLTESKTAPFGDTAIRERCECTNNTNMLAIDDDEWFITVAGFSYFLL